MEEVWKEVPLINLPHVLRATMVGTSDVEGSGLVVQCWCREEGTPPCPDSPALEIEQLLWCNSLRGLADTPQCQLEAAPAGRIRLRTEGSISQEELLAAVLPEAALDDKDSESLLACLAILRKYIPMAGLREDVAPRLFFEGGGQSRLVSGKFAAAEAAAKESKRSSKKIKSVDDLFADDGGFLAPASFDSAPKDDPFKLTELTSVHLVNEKLGFLFSLTCLQGYT
jgi:hypothetical protein